MSTIRHTEDKPKRQKYTVYQYAIYSTFVEVEADSAEAALEIVNKADAGTLAFSDPEYCDSYDLVRVDDESGEIVYEEDG